MLQPWDGFYILQRVLTCMISYEKLLPQAFNQRMAINIDSKLNQYCEAKSDRQSKMYENISYN